MEQEAKFQVNDRAIFAALQQLPELEGRPLTALGTEQQHNTYYDTPEGTLRAQHYMLRVREVGSRRIATLKWNGRADGAIHAREELETELGDGELWQQWPAGPLGESVAALLGEPQPLVALFSIATERERLLVWLPEAPQLELALDSSTIIIGERQNGFYELEAELLSQGSADDLQVVAEALQRRFELVPAQGSKYERGLALLDAASDPPVGEPPRDEPPREEPPRDEPTVGDPPRHEPPREEPPAPQPPDEPPPSEPIGDPPASEPARLATQQATNAEERNPKKIYADDTVAEAARKLLAQQARKLRKYAKAISTDNDAEDVHQMRVATRRMRATLKLTEGVFKPKALAPFAPMLRKLARALGAVRDRDVFLEHIARYRSSLPSEQHNDLDALAAQLRDEQQVARAALLKLLNSKRYAEAEEALTAFVTTPGKGVARLRLDAYEVAPTLVRHRVGSAIWSHYEELRAYETGLDAAPAETLHQMRIAGKRFRYTLELFEDVLDGTRYREVRGRLMEFQDELGALQDAEVSLLYLREFADRHPSPGLESYIADREAQRVALLAAVPRQWGRVSGLTFRRRLADVITQL
jgi:CHAD domain-containing protein/uncharacterized protein YjbK